MKGHKNIIGLIMTNYFKSLVDGYNQAKNEVVKATIYDAMTKYADEYHPGYTCYDMDMYAELYKCAITSPQRKHALQLMSNIIVDDSFQYHNELIENLKEVLCLTPFLKKDDITEFDILCMMELDYFKKELKWTEDQAKCGQADFIPDVPVEKVKEELKRVAAFILSTNMPNLESYKEAYKIYMK